MSAHALTDRLVNQEAQHKVGQRWPILAIAAGAVAGVGAAIALSNLWIDTRVEADGRMTGTLCVYVAGKRLAEREGSDLRHLERQMNWFSGGLIAAGMVSGGLGGLAAVWTLRQAFAKLVGPDGLV